MENAIITNSISQKRRTSIKRRFIIFSAILFSLIFISTSVVFVLFMQQIVQTNTGQEMVKAIEIERIRLGASVNGEIAIALKMADSPIIQTYFANPTDPELERIAFQEIAGYRRAFAGNTVFWVNDIDHKFYSDDAFAFQMDVNDPNNYWYYMTLNETEKYNFNINYNPDLDVTNLWINAPVFDARRKPIGILGTGIDLTAFINSIYQNYKGDATLFLFNADGEITGAKDSSLVANKVTINKELGNLGTEILARTKGLKPGEIQSFTASEGSVAVGEVPALGWYITDIQSLGLASTLKSGMTVLFLTMILVIALIFVIFYMFITSMLKPMNHMVQTLDLISADWDLTRRLNIQQNDEIGTLGEFFNQTFEKIMFLLKDIKRQTFSLSDTGNELSANMTETAISIEKINGNVRNMREKILTQASEVNKAAEAMERIQVQLENLNNHISSQSDSVAQSSSAIEQMLTNIRSVTDTLIRNTNNINNLAESSDAGRVDLQKVSADIQEIARESEGLLQINSVMQNIASQTNLLSMNAAIEAAHAGVSGKGFAVVADEIRKLAENSGKQSKTISAVLKKIKTSIDTITKSTSIVLERFGTIEQEVEIVSNQETQIRNAMEEQGVGSRQILEAITQLKDVTDLVRNASKEMTDESKEVMEQSSILKQVTSDVTGSIDEMSESAAQIMNVVTRVNDISQNNKGNIGALSEDIARFKVE